MKTLKPEHFEWLEEDEEDYDSTPPLHMGYSLNTGEGGSIVARAAWHEVEPVTSGRMSRKDKEDIKECLKDKRVVLEFLNKLTDNDPEGFYPSVNSERMVVKMDDGRQINLYAALGVVDMGFKLKDAQRRRIRAFDTLLKSAGLAPDWRKRLRAMSYSALMSFDWGLLIESDKVYFLELLGGLKHAHDSPGQIVKDPMVKSLQRWIGQYCMKKSKNIKQLPDKNEIRQAITSLENEIRLCVEGSSPIDRQPIMLVQMIAPYTNGLWQVVKQSDYLPCPVGKDWSQGFALPSVAGGEQLSLSDGAWLVGSGVPAAAYSNSSSPVSTFPLHRNAFALEKSLDSAAKNEGNPVYRFNSPRGYEDTFASPLEKGVEAREMPLSADKIDGIINTQPPRAGPKEGFLKPAKNIFSSSRRLLSNFKTIYLCIIKVSLRAKRSNLKSRIASPLPLLAMTRDNQFICSDIYARLYTYTGFIFNPVFLLIIAFIGLKLFLSKGFDCGDISNSVFIMLPCYRMFYTEELSKDAQNKEVKNEEEAERRIQDIEESVKEMDELLSELAEEIENDADLDSNVNDSEKHSILDITIRSTVGYLRSQKKSRSFEETLNSIATALQKKVLTRDSLDKVKGILGKETARDILKRIYEKAEKEIVAINGSGRTEAAAANTSGLSYLRQRLAEMNKHLGGHHHSILLGIFLAAYCILAFAFGLPMAEAGMPLIALAVSGKTEGPGEVDYVSLYSNDLNELAKEGRIDDTYYLSKYAAALNSQAVNPGYNNVMIIGDPSICQGLVEAVVVRKTKSPSLNNFKEAKFFEINTTRFAEGLAIPGQFELELSKYISALKKAYSKNRIVLVLNFQDFYDLYKIKGGMSASLYFQLKEAIEAENIMVVILANSYLYDEKLSKDKRLEPKFGIIDLRRPPEYDLLNIARDFTGRLESIYRDILPPDVKLSIDLKVLEEALRLSQKYYPQGLSVNKLQEVIDRVIICNLGMFARLAARVNEIDRRVFKAAKQLSRFIKDNQSPQEQDFLEQALDRFLNERRVVEGKIKENQRFLARDRKS